MPAPDPCVTIDSATVQGIVARDQRANSVASEGFSFLSEQSRLSYVRGVNFSDALAFRTVDESGSGRARILDTTLGGQSVSGK
jgi:hypothetical protein